MEKVASTTTRRNQHAVMVSSPGMGHLTSFMGLARRLSSLHSFKVTLLFVSSSDTLDEQYSSHDDDVSLVRIPTADVVDSGAHLVTKINAMMRETAPSIREAILKLRPTVLILGVFATSYLPIARELALPCFLYVFNAWCLAFHVHSPILDKEMKGEYGEQTRPICIPGCKSVRPEDVMEPMLQRNEPHYKEILAMGAQIPLFDGVIIMTWHDLEGPTLKALNTILIPGVPVYDIGPMVIEPPSERDDKILMEWLDRQPAHSVVYISFGSGGTLSRMQMKELALGLELSQQRFVWVVRPPTDEEGNASGTYLGFDTDDLNSIINGRFLPHGFEERTHESGMLVPQWAPQLKVLAHPSVGGFLTHCGWNSIMESLSKGVPMMAWPMYAEQKMNASFIVDDLKVAVRTSEVSGVVGRDEIARTLRVLLQGDEALRLRSRAKELQKGAREALAPNGSSYNRLSDFVQKSNHALIGSNIT